MTLAPVYDDALGAAMTLKRFAQEAFRRPEITMFAEEELDRVADAIDGLIEIDPLTANLDVGFVQVPLASDGPLASVEALQ